METRSPRSSKPTLNIDMIEALSAVRELVEAVQKTNSGGRLYPAPKCETVCYALDELARVGVLIAADGTATSLRGYAARPDSLARLERAANEVSL